MWLETVHDEDYVETDVTEDRLDFGAMRERLAARWAVSRIVFRCSRVSRSRRSVNGVNDAWRTLNQHEVMAESQSVNALLTINVLLTIQSRTPTINIEHFLLTTWATSPSAP